MYTKETIGEQFPKPKLPTKLILQARYTTKVPMKSLFLKKRYRIISKVLISSTAIRENEKRKRQKPRIYMYQPYITLENIIGKKKERKKKKKKFRLLTERAQHPRQNSAYCLEKDLREHRLAPSLLYVRIHRFCDFLNSHAATSGQKYDDALRAHTK